MKHTALVSIICVATTALLLATAAVIWSYRASTRAEIVMSEPVARFGQPATIEVSDTFSGVLSIGVSSGPQLAAPSWGGIVTGLIAQPGDRLIDGDPLAVIDGVERRLAATEAPYHRSLVRSDVGADVEQLQRMLLRWGYLAELPKDPTFFHWRTSAAVSKFASDIGVHPKTTLFDPGWVVWMPPELDVVTVAALPLTVGRAAPALGENVLVATEQIDSYELTATADQELPEFPGDWTITITATVASGNQIMMKDSVIDNSALAEVLASARADGEEEPSEDKPDKGDDLELTIAAESTTTSTRLTLPATSIRTSADASVTCVFARVPDESIWGAVRVSVLEAPGVAIAVENIDDLAGFDILFNPTEVLGAPLCPS